MVAFSLSRVASVPQAAPDSSLRMMIDSTVQQTYDYRFEAALATTDEMISAMPERPEGYIYKCGVYSKMLTEECFESPDSIWREYKHLVDEACRISKADYEATPDSVRALFNYASALVYRSRYDAMKSDWFGLMSDGVKSRKLLEKAVAVDTAFYDAYSGIGAFNYYAAHLPWYLKPVAFVLGISGNEEEGIAQLRKAASRGHFSRVEAATFLADVVFTDKKDYGEVAKLALALHTLYPENLDFVRSLCSACYKLHNYDKVVHYADQTIGRYKTSDSARFLSLAYIRFYRGESYLALKQKYDVAISDYGHAIEMGEPSGLVARAYYGRGSAYERLGKKNRAILDFETAIKLNGDDIACRQARMALDSLKGK
jgi:tetratricopeptide (TPR) repeat protein